MVNKPWRLRQHGPLTHWYLTTTVHVVTIRKTSAWNHHK